MDRKNNSVVVGGPVRRNSILFQAAIGAALVAAWGMPHPASAALTFDGDTATAGVQDGSGPWDYSTPNWYDGTTDTTFAPGSDAILGGGTSGTAGTVTIDSTASGVVGTTTYTGGVAANSVTFNAPAAGSYDVTGGNLFITGTGGTLVTVAANTSARIDSAFAFNGGVSPTLSVGTGANLTLAGGGTFTGNLTATLSGAGMIDIPSGAISDSNKSGIGFVVNGTVTQEAASIDVGNFGRFQIGDGGGQTGSYTVNSPTAVITADGTANNGNSWNLGRAGGQGTFTLQQGTVTTFTDIHAANDQSSTGTLNVLGGSLNVGVPATGTTAGTATIFANAGANYNHGATGTFNLSGGTVHALGLAFGGDGSTPTTSYPTSASGNFTQTGGTLVLDSGGIRFGTGVLPGTLPTNVSLSGGNIAASANWTGSVNMTLGTTNGNVTFEADDAATSPVAHNITLTGALSGAGGFNKSGAGQLLLSQTAANTYTGDTLVSAGTLEVGAASSLGSVASTANVTVAPTSTMGAVLQLDGATDLGAGQSLFLTDDGSSALATAILNYTGLDTISNFVYDGTYQPIGTYGGTGSGAANVESYLSGSGQLNVTSTVAAPEPSSVVLLQFSSLATLAGRRRLRPQA